MESPHRDADSSPKRSRLFRMAYFRSKSIDVSDEEEEEEEEDENLSTNQAPISGGNILQRVWNKRVRPAVDGLKLGIMDRTRNSDRTRSKSISDASDGQNDQSLLKRLLIRRHRSKMKRSNRDVSSTVDPQRRRSNSPVAPPSISMLDSMLSPDSAYYVTVSGGLRSKLLTFHPLQKHESVNLVPLDRKDMVRALNGVKVENLHQKQQETFVNAAAAPTTTTGSLELTSLKAIKEVYVTSGDSVSTTTDCSQDESSSGDATRKKRRIVPGVNDILCAKISPGKIEEFQSAIANCSQQPVNITNSRFIVSALSSQSPYISNLSQVSPDQLKASAPGIMRFIYKAPPKGVAADIDVADDILQVFHDQEIYRQFMKSHTCYQILPKSSKLVVFTDNLGLKKAFYALLYNGVRAACIFNSDRQRFVGMLTITDYIMALTHYHDQESGSIGKHFDIQTIYEWRQSSATNDNPLVSIGPDDSLFDAICKLLNRSIRRLLVIDPETGNALGIISHKRLLHFLFVYINDLPQPKYLKTALEKANIGTFENVQMITADLTIYQVLCMFIDSRVSALPVIETRDFDGKKKFRLVDIYSRFDVIHLAAQQSFHDLGKPIGNALMERGMHDILHTCTKSDNIFSVLEKLVNARVHRLVCVDHDYCVIGIVSLSDILRFLVLRRMPPPKKRRTKRHMSACRSQNVKVRFRTGSETSQCSPCFGGPHLNDLAHLMDRILAKVCENEANENR
ncbi:hypothetical protein ACOME3_001325 [Neoechinorhynchus agilis]